MAVAFFGSGLVKHSRNTKNCDSFPDQKPAYLASVSFHAPGQVGGEGPILAEPLMDRLLDLASEKSFGDTPLPDNRTNGPSVPECPSPNAQGNAGGVTETAVARSDTGLASIPVGSDRES